MEVHAPTLRGDAGRAHPAAAATPLRWSVAAGAVAFLVYLWLAPPVVGDGDASELTLALALNGAPHPTGYPIYVLLGHAFVVGLQHLGVTWAFAANAWSALGGGVAVALLHALAARLIPPEAPLSSRARALAGLLPVALFAPNPVWTHVTTLAEVYSWHQAWVMGTALAFVGLMRSGLATARPAETGAGEDARRWLRRAAGWGLLCGIGLSHHATSVLVAVPLTLALILAAARGRRLSPGAVAVAALAALLPLSSYGSLYVKATHPGPAVWPRLEPTWSSLFDHVTAARYRANLGPLPPLALGQRPLLLYIVPYLIPALALLLLGAARGREAGERGIRGALLAAALLQTLFCVSYRVPDPAPYFLPPLAIGLAAIAPLGADLAAAGSRPRRLVRWAAVALALAAALQLGPWLRIGAGRRDLLVTIDARVREMWASIPVERGIVLLGGDLHLRLIEYHLLMGEKPGLHLVSPWDLTVPMTRARFVARYGFDPFGAPSVTPGLVRPPSASGPAYEAFLEDLARDLRDATRQPVVLLSPASDSVRVLNRRPLRLPPSAVAGN